MSILKLNLVRIFYIFSPCIFQDEPLPIRTPTRMVSRHQRCPARPL